MWKSLLMSLAFVLIASTSFADLPYPSGNYRKTCGDIRWEYNGPHSRFVASCRKRDGHFRITSIDLCTYQRCKARLRNENGVLRCQP